MKRSEMTEEQRERVRQRDREWHRRNPEARALACKKWKTKHPESVKHHNRNRNIRRFGMTRNQHDALLSSQNAQCALCRCDEPGGKCQWHIDHSHVTGKVRGLLCHKCNTALGLFNDSIEVMKRAIAYVRKHG